MKKEKGKLQVRELIDKFQQNCDRITAIADACEKEQRERNEAENAEFEALTRENQVLQMKMQAATAEHLRENPSAQMMPSRSSARTLQADSAQRSCSCAT